jgi:hypothetical protein
MVGLTVVKKLGFRLGDAPASYKGAYEKTPEV